MSFLKAVEHYFGLYKQQYTHIYEEGIEPTEEVGNEMLREYVWEMVLLKERFISDTAHLTFIKGDGNGLLCCSLTIHLLKLALSDAFSHSLEQTENLVCFWLRWVQDNYMSIY